MQVVKDMEAELKENGWGLQGRVTGVVNTQHPFASGKLKREAVSPSPHVWPISSPRDVSKLHAPPHTTIIYFCPRHASPTGGQGSH